MPTVLGIDLGVSQCRTALARDGEVQSFPNRFSGRRLPLLVRGEAREDGGERIVFRGIIQELGSDHPGTFPSGASPAQAAEEIFRGIREDARERAGEDVYSAVVSVPAFYAERKRAALRKAAEAAGFERAHLLDESLSALLAAKLAPEVKRVLVFSLGAGVCAAAVVRRVGGVPQALSCEGLGELGGDDFDAAIVAYILGQLGLTAAQFRDGADSVQKLRAVAEQVKIGLSKRSVEEFDVHAKELFSDAALAVLDRPSVSLELSREKFEAMIAENVERALALAQKALEGAQLNGETLDALALAGGSTRIPQVEQRLRAQFGVEATRVPDDAIALGAAMHGAQLSAEAWQRREELVHSGPLPPGRPRRVALMPRQYEAAVEASGWAGMFAPALQEAEALWQSGKHAEAIAAVERLQHELPRFIANLHTQRGKLHYKEGQLDEAIACLEKSMQLDAHDKDARASLHVAYNRKTIALMEAGRYEEARNVIRKGVRLDSDCQACPELLRQIEALIEQGRFRGGPSPGFRRRRRR
jgi:molecular chaperone DnaK (HSP70)/Arc/MetJ-type ribon-helix-helix transcriptional regulator